MYCPLITEIYHVCVHIVISPSMTKNIDQEFSFNEKMWIRNDGKHKGSRHFISVPKPVSLKIKAISDQKPRKGFGSVKVEAMI